MDAGSQPREGGSLLVDGDIEAGPLQQGTGDRTAQTRADDRYLLHPTHPEILAFRQAPSAPASLGIFQKLSVYAINGKTNCEANSKNLTSKFEQMPILSVLSGIEVCACHLALKAHTLFNIRERCIVGDT